MQNSFTVLKIFCVPRIYILPCFLPHEWLATIIDLFSVPIIFFFSTCHTAGITHYGAFLNWLLSLSSKHLSFVCFFSLSWQFMHFYCWIIFHLWMNHNLLILSTIEGNFGCFSVWAIINWFKHLWADFCMLMFRFLHHYLFFLSTCLINYSERRVEVYSTTADLSISLSSVVRIFFQCFDVIL